MGEAKALRNKKKSARSDEDYGWFNPPEVVASIWWERYNANGVAYPEDGGLLEQDVQLDADLRTRSWLWGLANATLDQEDKIKQVLSQSAGQ